MSEEKRSLLELKPQTPSGLKSVAARVVKEGEWMDNLLTNVEAEALRRLRKKSSKLLEYY